jgi:homeobox protein cut-like
MQEATRAYESLNVLERGVLVLTRAILGNRRTRTAFICYAILLHLLVMFTTYECTTTSGTQLQHQAMPAR